MELNAMGVMTMLMMMMILEAAAVEGLQKMQSFYLHLMKRLVQRGKTEESETTSRHGRRRRRGRWRKLGPQFALHHPTAESPIQHAKLDVRSRCLRKRKQLLLLQK